MNLADGHPGIGNLYNLQAVFQKEHDKECICTRSRMCTRKPKSHEGVTHACECMHACAHLIEAKTENNFFEHLNVRHNTHHGLDKRACSGAHVILRGKEGGRVRGGARERRAETRG